jgi:hypothetical protein
MTYKIREVHIQLENGIRVVADADSLEDIRVLVDELTKLSSRMTVKATDAHRMPKNDLRDSDRADSDDDESPEALIEQRADLVSGSIKKTKLLGFKDRVPQLLRPAQIGSISDAALILMFAVEIGLKQTSLDFDGFKALYEAQNIKSSSPISMLLNNLKNTRYIDAKRYNVDRTVSLTAKGEAKAIEVLKSQVAKDS